MKHIPFILLLFYSLIVKAQFLPDREGPCFYILDPVVCVDDSFDIFNCSSDIVVNASVLTVQYDFGDGKSSPIGIANPRHAYSTEGLYTVKQEGNFPPNDADSVIRENYVKVLTKDPPLFEVLRCNLQSLTVRITDTRYEKYVVDWDDGSPTDTIIPDNNPGSNEASHAYPGPLIPRALKVTGVHPGRCVGTTDTSTVTPLPNIIVPVITSLQVTSTDQSDGSIVAAFQVNSWGNYVLELREKATGAYNAVDTQTVSATESFPSVLNYPIPGLNTGDNIYEVRLSARDECGQIVGTSQTLETINISVTALNKKNEIRWKDFDKTYLKKFTVFSASGAVVFSPDDPAAVLSKTEDPNTRCGTEYCYTIEALFYDTNAKSISNRECVTGSSTDLPPAPSALLASVEPSGAVVLNWTPAPADGAAAYEIHRAVAGSGSALLNSAGHTAVSYTDDDALESARCYRVRVADSCGNLSAFSPSSCPILLKVGNNADAKPLLSWTAFTGYSLGVAEYEIVKTELDGTQTTIAILPGTTLSYTDETLDTVNQIRIYTIKARPVGIGEPAVFSSSGSHIQRMKVMVPTAFTPNKDGLNDTFRAKTLFVKKYEMRVFNRWGQLIFASGDPQEGWDGTVNGTSTPPGSYAYDITAEDYTGRTFNEKGLTTLIK